MDKNVKLLKTAMDLHYRDRPHIVNKATHLVEEYTNNDQTNYKYDELLKALHHLMLDLPPTILLYYLTTIPFPNTEGEETRSTFLELMKKSRAFLLESINIVLNEYLNNSIPPLVVVNDFESNSESDNKMESENEYNDSYVPLKDTTDLLDNGGTNTVENKIEPAPISLCKSLLELSSEYVISNLHNLYQMYQNKNEVAWKNLTNNEYIGKNQDKCYKFIKDINTKTYWLRMIDAGYVPVDVLRDHYDESEIVFNNPDLFKIQSYSASDDAEKLKKAIQTYVSR